MEKKNNLLNEIEKAKEEGNDWKLRQLEGKLADFIIVDKNPLTIPSEELETIKVLETVKEGNTIFKA